MSSTMTMPDGATLLTREWLPVEAAWRTSEPLAAIPSATRVTYPGLRHEMLFEPEGPQVTADIIAWLAEQAA